MAHLEVFLQALSQRVWDLVEANELTHTQHLCVVTGSAWIQPLDNCWDIPKYTCIHKSCKTSEDQALWPFLNQFSFFLVFCSYSHIIIIYITWNRCEKRPLWVWDQWNENSLIIYWQTNKWMRTFRNKSLY